MDVNKQKVAALFQQSSGTVTIGIDGYVDEVWQLVKSRDEYNEPTMYTHMNQYADRINQASGGGMSIEIIRKRRTFGGFTANTGNAVSKLGIKTTMLSQYGEKNLDPVFEPFSHACRVISMGDPAVTQIYEFDDGKIMQPHVEPIIDFNWQSLVDALGMEKIVALMSESDIIALGYWSSMPAFDEIIAGICGCLPRSRKTRRIFFDFAELRKREESSLVNTLNLLRDLNAKIPMTLSMNEHEASQIFAIYKESLSVQHPPEPGGIENVRHHIGLDEIVVHTPYYAIAASSEGTATAAQDYCEKPVRTTGAGDTFNGGYIAASVSGLAMEERLWFSNTVVNYFLNNGEAPTLEQVMAWR
jgi:fructose-1-phosphate kinase PfkB-like protein